MNNKNKMDSTFDISVSDVTDGVTDGVINELYKCYAYTTTPHDALTDEYKTIYERVTAFIEKMDCAENVRAVMRLRYRYGYKFVQISQLLGITYQWVYELHKNGVSLFKKHWSV